MRQDISTAFLFGFVAAIGVVVTRIGVKQKRQSDIIIGILIAIGSIFIYFSEFF